MKPGTQFEQVEQAKAYLLDKIGAAPRLAVIMGGGGLAMEDFLPGAARLPYGAIPNFPVPKVAGHRGQAVFGKVGNTPVAVFEGRVHYYEGYSMPEVTFGVRVLGSLGVESLVLTNAAGAINPHFRPGQLMLITDHINLLGRSPLRGPNEDRWGPRFPDQTEVYARALRERLKRGAAECGIPMQEGVYAAMPGPSYETPAEVRFLRSIGADAVGMSTVPEAMVARHMGLKVAGISMLSNPAAGLSERPLSHDEVLDATARMQAHVARILRHFLEAHPPAS
jgi:purine-nucleoside phosphorylase